MRRLYAKFGRKMRTISEINGHRYHMNVAARRVMLLTLFSAKSKCTVSFRLMKIPLTSNKDPQNVANHLKDAGKLLKVHLMFKLNVELEVYDVCDITGN